MISPEFAVLVPMKWRGRHFHVLLLLGADEDGPVLSQFPGPEMNWQAPPHQLDWPVNPLELLETEHEEYRWRLDRVLDADAAYPRLRLDED
jgi:hypothetical protein